VRYIDDFVICFQYQSDAIRVQNALRKRLIKFGLELEPNKTKLVEFGRFAERDAGKHGRNRPETLYFLGFYNLLRTQPKRQLQGGFSTPRNLGLSVVYQPLRPDETNAALDDKRTSFQS